MIVVVHIEHLTYKDFKVLYKKKVSQHRWDYVSAIAILQMRGNEVYGGWKRINGLRVVSDEMCDGGGNIISESYFPIHCSYP